MNTFDPSTQHPAFAELARKYEIVDDAFTGDVCKYVEQISDQTKAERERYINRAAYYGVVQSTTSALIGALTRKPPTLTGTFPSTEFKTIDAFLQVNFKNLLHGSRTVLFVTVEDGKSKLVVYDADDVVNWAPDFVVIKEEELVRDAKNPYLLTPVCYYRELYLDETGYHSRRWVKTNKGRWVAEDLEDLIVNGSTIEYLPVFVANPYDCTWDVITPPLFTQAGLNLLHFRQTCDLEHYRHFMSLPTPYVAGNFASNDPDNPPVVKLGSTTQVLHLEADATFGYAEVTGNSFNMLRDNLKDVEERMFQSGSRLLTNKAGVESAAALSLRAANESAVLETMTNSLEAALNDALALCGEIDRETKSIVLNKDFNTSVIEPGMLKELLELYAAGVITLEQFQTRLYAGEVIGNETV